MERYIPHGVVNILNYFWQDLTAGAKQLKGQDQTYKNGTERQKSRGSVKLDDTCRVLSANDKKETGRRNPCAVGKAQVTSNTRMKKRKQSSRIGKWNQDEDKIMKICNKIIQ